MKQVGGGGQARGNSVRAFPCRISHRLSAFTPLATLNGKRLAIISHACA